MRIGIDARFLTHPQVGGFKTYTTNLVRALSESDHASEYVVYVDRSPADGQVAEAPNFSYRVVAGTMPALGMPLREQALLPWSVRKDHLDVLHCLCNTAPAGVAAKVVLTLHDVIQLAERPKLLSVRNRSALKPWAVTTYSRLAILRAARVADRIITPSQYERAQIIRQLKIPPQRVSVTPLSADSLFRAQPATVKDQWRRQAVEEYDLPPRFVLGIGHEPRKNIPLLLEAFAHVARLRKDIGLVVVVAVERTRRALASLAVKLELGTRVRLIGPVGPDELVRLYNLAEVFVFPSERESFGLPPLEAMSCGLPTIAMNATSIPEVVQDGGMLVEGTRPTVWADAINAVLRDPAAQTDLAQRGLQRASAFTWRRCAEETVAVYRAVAAAN